MIPQGSSAAEFDGCDPKRSRLVRTATSQRVHRFYEMPHDCALERQVLLDLHLPRVMLQLRRRELRCPRLDRKVRRRCAHKHRRAILL